MVHGRSHGQWALNTVHGPWLMDHGAWPIGMTINFHLIVNHGSTWLTWPRTMEHVHSTWPWPWAWNTVHGPWFMNHGAWPIGMIINFHLIVSHGSPWLTWPGAMEHVLSTWLWPWAWNTVHGPWFMNHGAWRIPRTLKKATDMALASKGGKSWMSECSQQKSQNLRKDKNHLKRNSSDCVRVWWVPILTKGKLHIEPLPDDFPIYNVEGLCRDLLTRLHDLEEAEGDRIRK